MRKVLLFLIAAFVFSPVTYSYGFVTKGQDCSKCHTLKKEEAEALLKELVPNLKVLDVRQSPMKAAWEVAIEAGGQKGVMYVDYSKKHLFSGSIVDIKAKKNLTQERFQEINKVDVASIPLKDALVMGDKDAKHKIIVFSDPD